MAEDRSSVEPKTTRWFLSDTISLPMAEPPGGSERYRPAVLVIRAQRRYSEAVLHSEPGRSMA